MESIGNLVPTRNPKLYQVNERQDGSILERVGNTYPTNYTTRAVVQIRLIPVNHGMPIDITATTEEAEEFKVGRIFELVPKDL